MIVEGLKLAAIGMLVVFSFLVLLVIVVRISTVLLKPYTEREERENMIVKRRKTPGTGLEEDKLLAIIGAAVAAHRRRMRMLQEQNRV